jgi:NitT/TauT family transport system substrate-binding protein
LRSRTIKALGASLILFLASPAGAADEKVRIGYTAVGDFASAFVAKERGFFAKHGIDAELTQLALNSTLPAALVSGSIDIGGVTPPVLLQAVAGGLDLKIVSGVSVTTDVLTYAAMARTQVSIKETRDFEGKKVGVPGLGATLHIIFVRWLKTHGVDPSKLTFVETAFPVQVDVLKAGTVDLVVTAQPNIDRIVGAGIGSVAVDVGIEIRGRPGAYWVSTSAWAKAKPAVVTNYREAIREAGDFIDTNPDQTRMDVAKYIKLPPPVIASLLLPKVVADIRIDDVEWWIQALADQKLIDETLDAASLVSK